MEGLVFLDYVPTRHTREEFEILYDEPVYQMVRRYASRADMQEIDGWARSFYTLEGHLESIQQFAKPLLREPSNNEWMLAKAEVKRTLQREIGTITALSFETGLDYVPYESSSAAGYGYQGKKGEGDNFKKAKGIANALVRTFEEHVRDHGIEYAREFAIKNSTPDVAFTRTQLSKLPSIKVRNVFGEAFHLILIEGLSASPLLEAFKGRDTFYVTGKDPTTYVPQYLSRLDQIDGWIVALDWSKFDATVQLWEIDHAFDCLESVLTFPTALTRTAFEVTKTLFSHRKLAAPDGKLWMRHSGIPSGSYFTNIIGSIINYTRVLYLCNKMGYPLISARVQGDDSVMKVEANTQPDVLAMARCVTEFGWILNPLKCVVSLQSEDVDFLGRGQRQLFNIRERLKVLRLMCFPEYKVDDSAISTARARMIATDAGFRDPLYNEIVFGLKSLYGEASEVPARYRTYFDVKDWTDVNF